MDTRGVEDGDLMSTCKKQEDRHPELDLLIKSIQATLDERRLVHNLEAAATEDVEGRCDASDSESGGRAPMGPGPSGATMMPPLAAARVRLYIYIHI